MATETNQTQEEKLVEAYEEAPEDIKGLLASEDAYNAIESISTGFNLDEGGAEKMASYVGLVLLGFLHPKNLAEELKKSLGVGENIAEGIAKEIDQEIFVPIKGRVEEMYPKLEEKDKEGGQEKSVEEDRGKDDAKEELKPKPENETKTDEPASLASLATNEVADEDKPKPFEGIAKDRRAEKGEPEKPAETPFVLHKEDAKPKIEAKGKQIKKGFSFSLGKVFGQKEAERKKPTAKVEAPGEAEHKAMSKKEEPKVVHYSEHRTQPDMISEEKLTKPAPKSDQEPLKPPTPPTPPSPPTAPQKPPEQKQDKPEGPKIDGSTINLKDLGERKNNN